MLPPIPKLNKLFSKPAIALVSSTLPPGGPSLAPKVPAKKTQPIDFIPVDIFSSFGEKPESAVKSAVPAAVPVGFDTSDPFAPSENIASNTLVSNICVYFQINCSGHFPFETL